jgi:hypothetical protein
MAKASRDEWRKLVEQWKRSGLSAAEFGAPLGIDSQSLRSWKWRLGRDQHSQARRSAGIGEVKRDKAIKFVELGASRLIGERRFELALDAGRRLYIPMDFDESALRKLLSALDPRG